MSLFPSECEFGGRMHVCKLDKKDTLAGKLMVVVQTLWLLCCLAGAAQCDHTV